MHHSFTRTLAVMTASAMTFLPVYSASAQDKDDSSTKTPIKHVVVIFQENVSFDHYFGTYPHASPNKDGSKYFAGAKDDTPRVNSLESAGLLINNPNAANPFRIDRSNPNICDEDHGYGDEQFAFDDGLMDRFAKLSCNDNNLGPFSTMGYYDGNTVTAMWNYAQTFAMSDNSYGTTFGPSTPGLLNLVAGITYPATTSASSPKLVGVSGGTGTLVGDLDPTGDVCSGTPTVQMGGQNLGDLLNAKGISWGSFMGGFDLTITNPSSGSGTGCKRMSPATPANGGPTADYIPHHAFFQYWASTANPTHARPTVPPSKYGTAADTGANHEYDIHDFFDALNADNLPAVSFLKAPANMDGHAGYSDPLLEQEFVVNTINTIQKSKFWRNTAIIISYDDSDGWYDHQMSPIINPSAIASADTKNSDQLNDPGECGNGSPTLKNAAGSPIEGRCGYGPRLPLIVISPFAKT